MSCGKKFQRWAEVLKHSHPSYQPDILDPIYMNIGKLGISGDLTSETFNGERKTRHLIVEQVNEAEETLRKDDYDDIRVLEVDCWNHLRNVWLWVIKKDLSNLIGNTMREELDGIDLRLRVLTIIKSVLCAINQDFSLCANDPKRHGELFREWIETYHHGELILHVEKALGYRQDISVEGAGAVYMNLPYRIELLDKHLQMPGDKITQENIFIILLSLEMTALARLCAIIHITICLPTCWLAGNFHIISDYNWSVHSMWRTVDELETAMEYME